MFIQKDMNQKKNKQKAFSIPEVIVALAIVVLVIVSATDLLVSSNRANNLSIKNVIAFNLAQEALEGFRNIRDGHWIQNENWKGVYISDMRNREQPIIIMARKGDLSADLEKMMVTIVLGDGTIHNTDIT